MKEKTEELTEALKREIELLKKLVEAKDALIQQMKWSQPIVIEKTLPTPYPSYPLPWPYTSPTIVPWIQPPFVTCVSSSQITLTK